MIGLISLHIPRTAGTSFYQILKQVYGESLSISLRRRDLKTDMNERIDLVSSLAPGVKVIHGHLYYDEVKEIHQTNNSKVICWLREPAARVISNYRFFMHGLQNPQKNPAVYQLNKHRVNETLMEFAQLEENRNRMSKFLDGLALDDLYFYGILESFNDDLKVLSKKLNWSDIKIPHLNNVPHGNNEDQLIDKKDIQQIRALNALDIELYNRALELKKANLL